MKLKLRILPLLLAAMFSSCTPERNEQISKNAFSEYEIVNRSQIIWPTLLEQNEDHYLVFFYSETCSHCHEIMGDVISFADQNIIKTYFLNTKDPRSTVPISNDVFLTIGESDLSNIFIKGTPSIIEVKNATVMSNITGKDNCLTFLNMCRLHDKI